ncbi:MAG: hypothetical protein Q9172_006080 [Xanthocarpia lactea]
MASFTRLAALAALLASSAGIVAAVETSGSGTTTRYWDCCKPSCAWTQPGLTSTVKTCDINDNPLANGVTATSGCQPGGTSFMCSDQSPWVINENLAYGFAAVTASNPTCCQCYKLTFTSEGLKGKTMIVQATNTGYDVNGAQFDLAIPGGGFGLFDGCSREWKATSDVWGAQYGGSNTNTCSNFPSALQKGCGFRWDWMGGVSNPKYALFSPIRSSPIIPPTPFHHSDTHSHLHIKNNLHLTSPPSVNYELTTCPAAIVAKSGCSVPGYSPPSSPREAQQKQPTTIKTSTTKAPKITTTTTTPQKTTTTARTPAKKASYPNPVGDENDVINLGARLAVEEGIDDNVAEVTASSSAVDALATTKSSEGEEEVNEDSTCES